MQKRFISFLLALALVITMVPAFGVEAYATVETKTFYVDANSTADTHDGTENHPYKTLQDALNVVHGKTTEDADYSSYTINLLSDIELTTGIQTIAANVTINGNGHSIKAVTDSSSGAFNLPQYYDTSKEIYEKKDTVIYRKTGGDVTWKFTNLTIDANGLAGRCFYNEDGAGENIFENCTFKNAKDYGVHISGSQKNYGTRDYIATFDTCSFSGNTKRDIYIGNAGNKAIVKNCTATLLYVNSGADGYQSEAYVSGVNTVINEIQSTYASNKGASKVYISEGKVNTLTGAGLYCISGGVFNTQVQESWCAEGYEPISNTDASTKDAYPYTVGESPAVAQIGSTTYKTLLAAYNGAQNGDTIDIIADCSTEPFEIKKEITIDGHNYTVSGWDTYDNAAIDVYDTVTIKNIVFDGFACGEEDTDIDACVLAAYSGSDLTVTNCAFKNFNRQAITFAPGQVANMTVANCSFDCTPAKESFSIQKAMNILPGKASDSVTIKNCTITNANSSSDDWSSAGIEIFGGTVSIENCLIERSEYGIYVVRDYYSGCQSISGGDVDVDVTIKGNTRIIESSYPVVLICYQSDNTDATVKIQSGQFIGSVYRGKTGSYSKDVDFDKCKLIISGGIYSTEPAIEYIASGYCCIDNPDPQTKTQYPYKVAPLMTMENYAYGDTPSTPSHPAISGATATVYYSTNSFLDETNEGTEWQNILPTTLKPGNYFMKTVYASDTTLVAETPQTTFSVTKGTQAAPAAPTASGNIVTIASADRNVQGKSLEYAVDGTSNWMTVPKLSEDGSFTVSGLTAGNHIVYLRWRENSLFNASDNVSVNISLTQYSVSYNLNYGVGTSPEIQTAVAPGAVIVASGDGIARTGYIFSGWNTKPDGTGTTYAAGSTISNGATLYAQWTANSFTVKFNKNGGEGSLSNQNFTYDVSQALTENTFTRTGYTFAGWATSAGGKLTYLDKQNVKNLAASGTLTLYAVWTQNTSVVSGTISTDNNSTITVELKQGATTLKTTNAEPSGSGPYSADVIISDVPYGTYNLVITQGNVVVTQILVNSAATNIGTITMPDSNVNSVLEVKENTPAVVVGNLDKEAESKAEDDKNVFVIMTVEKQEEQALPETASVKEQDTQEAIAAIETKAEEVTQPITEEDVQLDYLNITVEKYVGAITMTLTSLNTATTTETVLETNNVMEVIVPYDMSGKENIIVYRYHDGQAETFASVNSVQVSPYTDATYYVDTDDNLIYIYTNKFSTYGISYTKTSSQPISGGGGGGGTSVSNVTGSAVVTKTACPQDSTCVYAKFTDAKTTEWYHDGVHFCVENGYMNGMSAIKFAPNGTLSRAMIVQILWNMEGKPVADYAMTFKDVDADQWYTEAIRWAQSTKVVEGYNDTFFGPEDNVTREQLAAILYRYAQTKGEGFTGAWMFLLDAPDRAEISSWASEAMHWVYMKGILTGDTSGKLRPTGNATRAEAACMVQRFCDNIGK